MKSIHVHIICFCILITNNLSIISESTTIAVTTPPTTTTPAPATTPAVPPASPTTTTPATTTPPPVTTPAVTITPATATPATATPAAPPVSPAATTTTPPATPAVVPPAAPAAATPAVTAPTTAVPVIQEKTKEILISIYIQNNYHEDATLDKIELLITNQTSSLIKDNLKIPIQASKNIYSKGFVTAFDLTAETNSIASFNGIQSITINGDQIVFTNVKTGVSLSNPIAITKIDNKWALDNK